MHCHTLITRLRQRGYRITPQREMIIESLVHSPQHQTAEAIHAQLKSRAASVNLATVYRTLDLLVSEGLASRADMLDNQMVYTTALHGAHVHLVCRCCGQVLDASVETATLMLDQIEAQFGFAADGQHISLAGLCRECQNSPKEV